MSVGMTRASRASISNTVRPEFRRESGLAARGFFFGRASWVLRMGDYLLD
jgi:hypothetical protein